MLKENIKHCPFRNKEVVVHQSKIRNEYAETECLGEHCMLFVKEAKDGERFIGHCAFRDVAEILLLLTNRMH